MKNTLLKWFSIFLFCLTTNIQAQDAFMGYRYSDATIPFAWSTSATTFNSSTNKEVIFSNADGGVKSAVVCNTTAVSHYELGGSTQMIEISLTANSNGMLLSKIVITGSSNSTTVNGGAAGIIYSDKLVFDLNSVIAAEQTAFFPTSDGTWTDITLNPPAGAKSARIYRRIFYNSSTKVAKTSSSTGFVQYGLGQTLRVASIAAWVTSPLPYVPVPALGTASAITTTGFTANWTAEANANGYIVKVYEGTTPVKTENVIGQATSSLSITGLTANKNYTYTVTGTGDFVSYQTSAESAKSAVFKTLNTEKAVTAISLLGANGTINEGAKTISVTVPYSTTLPTSVTPVISISNYATLITTGALTFNENTPATTITVQAEDGTTQDYAVTVTKAPASTACNITSFSTGYATESIIIDQTAKTISVTVSSSNDITNLTPVVGNSALSTISSPAFPTDFTNPVNITVLAEDGITSKTYTVTTVKDGTSPILTSSTPSNTQTGVSLAGIITLNYDETVVLGSGTITISAGTLGTPVIVGSKVKIPFSGLTSLTPYSLTIPAGMFTDIYGNSASGSTINFTTADGENHATWYASYMDAENFAIPAFISPATAYIDSIDVKAASINQYGAYKLAPGDTLTIRTDSVGYASIIAYALAGNRSVSISNSVNANVSSYTFAEYENRGTTVSQLIDVANETTPTEIYIVNTSVSGDIFIPYISLSEVGSTAPLDEKTVFCK